MSERHGFIGPLCDLHGVCMCSPGPRSVIPSFKFLSRHASPCRFVALGHKAEGQQLRAAQRLCQELGLELSVLNASMVGHELERVSSNLVEVKC